MATYNGEGTIFKVGTTSTTAAVAGTNTISLGAIEQAGVDNYSLTSTSKTQRASGQPDFGSLSVDMYFDPADTQHQLLRDSAANGANLFFEVLFTSGDKATGQGFVTSFEINGMESDNNLSASVELKINTLAYVDA